MKRFWLLGILICSLPLAYWAGWKRWPVHKPGSKHSGSPDSLVHVADRATAARSGPWGNLEFLPLSIEIPEEYLPIKVLEETGTVWNFAGYSPEQVTALLESAELSAEQKTELLDTSKWSQSAEGVALSPSADLVYFLSPGSRKIIYSALLQIPASGLRGRTIFFPKGRFLEFFDHSGVTPEVIHMVEGLTFQHGNGLFFCDIACVLGKIDTYEEKVRFVKTITRKSTLLLRLHILPDTDLNPLMAYWSKAAWGKDIKPMLESLKRVPGGARLSLVHLLPPFPSASLYTYPFPSRNPEDLRKDCHWTALNFFRDVPDPRFVIPGEIQKAFREDYYPILSDPRYGDVIQLVRPNGDVIHSAIFIADDIVYTKNSAGSVEPFMLMKMSDMLEVFSAFVPDGERLQTSILRHKYY